MAAELFAGAALGALCQELLKLVQVVAIKAVMFNSILKRLQTTLNRITPIIEDIEKLDRLLDRPKSETEMFTNRLNEGLNLVRKCGKVKWWNYCVKPLYAKELEELENSISKFFLIDVPLLLSRDSRMILVGINGIDGKLDRIATMGGGSGKSGSFVGCCGPPEVPELVVGLEEPLQGLKMKILLGEERVVVLSAPGGCGKTTLAKMMCHDVEIKDVFKDNIFFVTFSKAYNLEVIIEKMLQHKGFQVPEFQSEEEAVNHLERRLKQIGPNPVLLVLDDACPGSESHIEKFNFQIPKYKILVTSRSVFPRFCTYELKLLNDQDAMELFRHSAFPQDGSSCISDGLVNKIVRGCKGFPLGLNVVGRSLCGQPEVIWKRMLKQWSEGKSIFSSNNDLLIRLQPSIDALDGIDGVKECYLDLASFPEDQRIPVTALMDMWTELYNQDEDGEDAIANLYELSHRNLVNLALARKGASEADGYYNEHFVVQHDILRELAIHLCSQQRLEQRERLIMNISGSDIPKWWIEQKQHLVFARLVSISIDEPVSNWYNMELPNVKVLVLNIQARNYSFPQFVEKIDHLKALIVTNNDFYSAEISNFSLLGHLQSMRRIRLEHISISSITESILQLTNLRKISLIMCKINEAFKDCAIVVPNMPNLVEIVIDYCSDLVELPTWLCNISSLEKLSITNCHELIGLSEEFGKLENLEVLRLHACTKLLELPESIGSLQKLHFLDLSDCISITSLPEGIGELCGLRKLNMRGCWGLAEVPASVTELDQLKSLICDEETSCLWEQYKIFLTNLKLDVLTEAPNLGWLQG